LRIGLTGGIACGKSSVANIFVEQGVFLVDTDSVAREVVAPGQPGLDAVRSEFGASVISDDGELDRRTMRKLILHDADSRRRLEAILHPLIRERTLALLSDADGPYALVAVPLLLETNFAALVDRVLVVDCPEDIQLKRLMQRDQLDRTEAQAAIQAQIGRATRLEAADDVIDNGGAIQATREQVIALHQRYLRLAEVCRAGDARAE